MLGGRWRGNGNGKAMKLQARLELELKYRNPGGEDVAVGDESTLVVDKVRTCLKR